MIMLLLLLCIILNHASCGLNQPYTFSYPAFDRGSCGEESSLVCMGSVTAGNGSLSITPHHQQQFDRGGDAEFPENKVGRVLHRHPVVAWPASLSTFFTIRISKSLNSSSPGDGMAFIIAQDSRPSPPQSFGPFLGILDESAQGGVRRQLAVELDTYKSVNDPDSSHISIDTTSVSHPVAAKSLNSTGIDLRSSKEIMFKIEYDGMTKVLQIQVGYAGESLVNFLNHSIIMEDAVPSLVYVGFTASTSTFSDTYQVLHWNFTSSALSMELGKKNKNMRVMLIIIGIPIAGVLLLLTAFALRGKQRAGRAEDIEMLTRNAASCPRMFTHKQLSKATHNFTKENLLGSGGFGSVYKGFVSDPPTPIAVKRVSSTSKQGKKEYLAEICTIGRLRHKNLLQLQGWCHESHQLLLVYDYMPNGSLDRFIGKDTFLEWKTRHKILVGLASALVYLHEECENPVVHRDVKPNNVMLDSEYNAHLGDFGLARLLQNQSSVTTIIAGTPGYLAPEVSFTGKATPESDVYSFGMVALELVCGRRSKASITEETSLVDCVWSLYEKGALLQCVDQKLEGNYEHVEAKRALVVALACLHPDYSLRPKMRKVVQILMNKEEPLVKLPECRPSSICISFRSPTASTTTDFGSVMELPSPDEMTLQYDL